MSNIRLAKVYHPSKEGKAAIPYYRVSLRRKVTHTLRITEAEARELHRLFSGYFREIDFTFWQWLKQRFGKR